MSRVSLVRRTRLLMVAVAALSVAVVFAVFYLAWTTYTIRLRTQELSRQTVVIASGAEVAGESALTADDVRARLFRVEAGLIGATLALTDEQGAVLLSTRDADEIGSRYPIDRLGDPDADGVRSAVADVADVGRVLMVAAPVDGEAAAYVVALQPLQEVNSSRGWVVLLLALSAGVAVVVAWLAGGASARRLAGPIVRLERASEAIAAGDWGHQAPVEGDDEVSRLATAFNRMSSRVAAAYGAQKDFVGNVSHELRTPVTTIAGFAGALLDGTVDDEATRERYLRVVRDEAERIGDLAATLLTLADLDAGTIEPRAESVELSQIGDVLAERYGETAAARGLRLDVSGLAGEVAVDQGLLTQALSTLVENAVRYTPDGGRVDVSAAIGAAGARLVVDDSGPGVPEEMRDAVFERFTRLDPSRAKDEGGSGLGLAICRRLVDILGGTVWIERSDLGGARFVIKIPRTPS